MNETKPRQYQEKQDMNEDEDQARQDNAVYPKRAQIRRIIRAHRAGSRPANHSFGSAARTRASGRPSSRRTILVPSTSATHL